jgi:hypothetical protein
MLTAANKLYKRVIGSKKWHGELILTRSEGRESLVQFIKKIIYNLELSTMTVCNNDISFSKPRLKDITADASDTGLSHTRAKRVQQKLVEGEYLRVVRSPKYVNGEFKADPSVREVTPKLFKVLGLGQEYSFQKHIKTKRLEKRAAKNGFQRELVMRIKENLVAGREKGVKTGSFPENRQHRANLIKLYVDVCKRKCPDMSAVMLRSSAERMSIENLEKLVKYHRDTVDTS